MKYKYKTLTKEELEKILIAITTRGNDLNIGLVTWLLQTTSYYPILNVHFFRGRLCAYMSQHELHMFMLGEEGKKYDHVLMIDADVVPAPYVLEMLYYHKKDIIAAPTWHYGADEHDIHVNVHPHGSSKRIHTKPRKRGIQRVTHCSMATTLINRRIYDAFVDEPLYYNSHIAPHLHQAPSDVLFTHKVIKKGFEIWVNWDVQATGHYQHMLVNDKLLETIRTVKVSTVPEWDCAE